MKQRLLCYLSIGCLISMRYVCKSLHIGHVSASLRACHDVLCLGNLILVVIGQSIIMLSLQRERANCFYIHTFIYVEQQMCVCFVHIMLEMVQFGVRCPCAQYIRIKQFYIRRIIMRRTITYASTCKHTHTHTHNRQSFALLLISLFLSPIKSQNKICATILTTPKLTS